MMAQLAMSGLIYNPDVEKADILLVNTCGFIDAAKLESIETMQEICDVRQPHQRVIVTGCLYQRYPELLAQEFPQVDAFLTLQKQHEVAHVALELMGKPKVPQADFQVPFIPRMLATPPHMAYLRIADGCFHQCSFCAIPSFRGNLRSVPIETLVAEAQALVEGGAQELVLIAQDSTSYGYDIYGRFRLVELLTELERIEGLRWLRLMYVYPTLIDRRLLEYYRTSQKLVSYVDMPIQHGSEEILRAMRRGSRPHTIRDVVQRFRETRPNMHIRTTIIVGFPGEEERHFQETIDLLEELQFDHVGVFRYSDEDGTPAMKLPNKVADDVREDRFRKMTEWAAQQAQQRNQRYVGRIVDVLVDSLHPDDGTPWGRHEGQAPECDGQVCLIQGRAKPGEFIRVRITESDNENLYGIRHRPAAG